MFASPSIGAAPTFQPSLFEAWNVFLCAGDEARTPTSTEYTYFDLVTAPPLDGGNDGLARRLRGLLLESAVKALAENRVTIDTARSIGLTALELAYAPSVGTAEKYRKESSRFFRHLRACGVEFVDEIQHDHIESFVWSATRRNGSLRDVSASTASNRQSILRSLFRELERLGVTIEHGLLGESIQRENADPTRLLTSVEIDHLRSNCTGGYTFTRDPLLLALSEAGGSATEIAAVRGADLDLSTGTVTFPGPLARSAPLTNWGVGILRLINAEKPFNPEQRVAVGRGIGPNRGAHSVSVGLYKLLRDAGLGRDHSVSARSIRLTFARHVFERDGIEAAARFLGSDSLDATARAIGHEWRVA